MKFVLLYLFSIIAKVASLYVFKFRDDCTVHRQCAYNHKFSKILREGQNFTKLNDKSKNIT